MEEDPFGLNKFLTEAKRAKRPSEDTSTRCVNGKGGGRELRREEGRGGERFTCNIAMKSICFSGRLV